MMLIEAEHLTKRYGHVRAVDDVSFGVERGEVVGFLGPNGAGKTTTMRMLTGFLPPTSGTARIAGHEVFRDSIAARRHIGYMPEGLPLYPEMRVIEYLRYRARIKGVPPRERPGALAESMARCGVADVTRKLVGSLSKGYRQRVGLADALLNDPPILILDEPTIGLDPNQVRQARALIRELGRERTVLLSTHILSEVDAVCRRALIIHEGRLVFSGPVGEAVGADHGALFIEARGPEDRIAAVLAALPGVVRVTAEGGGRFALVQRPRADVREEVFRALAKNEWPLLELRPRRGGLEDVFVRVTAGEEF